MNFHINFWLENFWKYSTSKRMNFFVTSIELTFKTKECCLRGLNWLVFLMNLRHVSFESGFCLKDFEPQWTLDFFIFTIFRHFLFTSVVTWWPILVFIIFSLLILNNFRVFSFMNAWNMFLTKFSILNDFKQMADRYFYLVSSVEGFWFSAFFLFSRSSSLKIFKRRDCFLIKVS